MYEDKPGLTFGATVDLNRALRNLRSRNLGDTADRREVISAIREVLTPYDQAAHDDAFAAGHTEGYMEGRDYRLEADGAGSRPMTLTMEIPEEEFAIVIPDANTIGTAIRKALNEYYDKGGDLERCVIKTEAYELSYESGIRVHIEGYLRKGQEAV